MCYLIQQYIFLPVQIHDIFVDRITVWFCCFILYISSLICSLTFCKHCNPSRYDVSKKQFNLTCILLILSQQMQSSEMWCYIMWQNLLTFCKNLLPLSSGYQEKAITENGLKIQEWEGRTWVFRSAYGRWWNQEMAGTSIWLAILEFNSLASYSKMEEHKLGYLDLCTYNKWWGKSKDS
jgi:hypothetical protein